MKQVKYLFVFIGIFAMSCMNVSCSSEDSDKTIAADYAISNHVITFSYIEDGQKKTFEGYLTDDGRTINFQENPIVKSMKVIRK